MLEETSSKINKKIIGNIPIYISILFTFLFHCYWFREISREINLNNKKKYYKDYKITAQEQSTSKGGVWHSYIENLELQGKFFW